jgi:hypothetical protein
VLFPALCRGQGPVAVVSNHLERQYRPMHKGDASSPVVRERGVEDDGDAADLDLAALTSRDLQHELEPCTSGV